MKRILVRVPKKKVMEIARLAESIADDAYWVDTADSTGDDVEQFVLNVALRISHIESIIYTRGKK